MRPQRAIARLVPSQLARGWRRLGDVNRFGVDDITAFAEPLGLRVQSDIDADELGRRYLQSPRGLRLRPWGCMRVAGNVPFSTIGLLASLTAALAESHISVFALSTFNTDYLFVKQNEMRAAVVALRARGHVVE